MSDKEHKPVRRDDVVDERLVAGQLRALQAEVSAGFELLTQRLETMMERFATTQDDHAHRIGKLERDSHHLIKRVDAIEQRKPGAKRLR